MSDWMNPPAVQTSPPLTSKSTFSISQTPFPLLKKLLYDRQLPLSRRFGRGPLERAALLDSMSEIWNPANITTNNGREIIHARKNPFSVHSFGLDTVLYSVRLRPGRQAHRSRKKGRQSCDLRLLG